MKPTSAGKDTQHELDQTLKKLACVSNQWGPLLSDYLDEHYANPISVQAIAQHFFVSPRTLQRRFLKVVNLTVIQYLQKLRLHNACQLIELTRKGIAEISYEVGYQDVSAFRKVFLREFGLTPTELRKRFCANPPME
ncbi:helix-turn-helix domain-containing protein [Veronia nyctiphanis]|nr:AraC family transcriptional regulator [Veronia nyctiphanis]